MGLNEKITSRTRIPISRTITPSFARLLHTGYSVSLTKIKNASQVEQIVQPGRQSNRVLKVEKHFFQGLFSTLWGVTVSRFALFAKWYI